MEGAGDHARGLEDWGYPGGLCRPGTGEPVAPAGVRGNEGGGSPSLSVPVPLGFTHVLGLSSQPQKLASHWMSR